MQRLIKQPVSDKKSEKKRKNNYNYKYNYKYKYNYNYKQNACSSLNLPNTLWYILAKGCFISPVFRNGTKADSTSSSVGIQLQL